MLAQVVGALQPLIHEAFGGRPLLHRTIEQAFLKVVFHDLERLMDALLRQRDEWMEAAETEEQGVKETMESLLNSHEAQERRQWSSRLELMADLTQCCDDMTGMARHMGVCLNLVLDSAGDILKATSDPKIQAAVMNIAGQVEVMIHLREPLWGLAQAVVTRLNMVADNETDQTDGRDSKSRPYSRLQVRARRPGP